MWNSGTCRAWEPAVDVYRTVEGWVVKFDLAGVDPEDLSVKIVGHTLVVTGTRRDRTLRGNRAGQLSTCWPLISSLVANTAASVRRSMPSLVSRFDT